MRVSSNPTSPAGCSRLARSLAQPVCEGDCRPRPSTPEGPSLPASLAFSFSFRVTGGPASSLGCAVDARLSVSHHGLRSVFISISGDAVTGTHRDQRSVEKRFGSIEVVQGALWSGDSGARWPGVQILAMPIAGCVTLGKLFNISELQRGHQKSQVSRSV